MKRSFGYLLLGLALLLCAYVGLYGVAMSTLRKPAANLRYFVYSRAKYSQSFDEGAYYFFYPLYCVHGRLLKVGFVPHNLDRATASDAGGP